MFGIWLIVKDYKDYLMARIKYFKIIMKDYKIMKDYQLWFIYIGLLI